MSKFEDLFIFEMANNHQGSLEHGLRIVEAMARVARAQGVSAAVKLQYRDLDTFIHPDFKERDDIKHVPRFMSTRLAEKDFRTMVDAIRAEGMTTVITPFDEASVERALSHGVDILKVASCSATDWPLLTAIADTRKPVIVSTGGIPLYEIDRVVSFLQHREVDFALMHCIGMYPAPDDALHMSFVEKMRCRYPDVVIGYSGHEAPENLDPARIAVGKGARFFERHVGVPTDEIKLNAYSLNPEQADAWVAAVLKAQAICGPSQEKPVRQQEVDSLRTLMRGVYTRRPVKQGQVIARDDVFFAMPLQEHQLTSGQFGRYRTQYIASRDYAENEPVCERAEQDDIDKIRSIIHDARGMLYEAQIELGKDVQIELSHHYGLDEFRRVGAVIVNVVNRQYCKKIIMVFPGQQHPAHAHRKKEETFQLLWGDLEVDMEGRRHRLVPGDTMLVEVGQLHSFFSRGGAIFEEVSTTAERDDSFYEDEVISVKDPLERKTLVQNW